MSDHARKQLTKKRHNNISAKKKDMIRREIGTTTFAMLEKGKSFRYYSRRDRDARSEETIILSNSALSLSETEGSDELLSIIV